MQSRWDQLGKNSKIIEKMKSFNLVYIFLVIIKSHLLLGLGSAMGKWALICSLLKIDVLKFPRVKAQISSFVRVPVEIGKISQLNLEKHIF